MEESVWAFKDIQRETTPFSGFHSANRPHQLTWKCKKALSKRKVVFLQGSVYFQVSWWKGSPISRLRPAGFRLASHLVRLPHRAPRLEMNACLTAGSFLCDMGFLKIPRFAGEMEPHNQSSWWLPFRESLVHSLIPCLWHQQVLDLHHCKPPDKNTQLRGNPVHPDSAGLFYLRRRHFGVRRLYFNRQSSPRNSSFSFDRDLLQYTAVSSSKNLGQNIFGWGAKFKEVKG